MPQSRSAELRRQRDRLKFFYFYSTEPIILESRLFIDIIQYNIFKTDNPAKQIEILKKETREQREEIAALKDQIQWLQDQWDPTCGK